MKHPKTLQTKRLLLRKPCLEDATAIFEGYARDPDVTRYLVWRPHQSIQESYRFLMACNELWQAGKDFAYVVTLKEDGVLIGMFAIHPMDTKIEVGYVLSRRYWGQGYMTEALRGMIDWAFTGLDIFRIQAICDVDNIASARVMEKAGMTREGLLRRYVLHPNISAEPRDSFMYAIVK